MKKKTLTLALCAAMMLSVTACGGNKDESSSAAPSSSAVTSEASTAGAEESKAPESSAAGTESSAAPESSSAESSAVSDAGTASLGSYASVEEFAASDDIQSQIEAMKESLNEAGMDIAVTGEGDKLIYTYTYKELTDEDGTMEESIKTQMDAQASTFTAVANTIKAAVDVEKPVVVVRYLDANGEEIFSGEYPAE